MKKRITGVIVSDSMDKTRVIEVTRRVLHPLYKKRYKVTKRFYAHDQENKTKVGDEVVIEEIRPLSRLKRWIIVSGAASSEPAAVEGKEQAKLTEPEKVAVSTEKLAKRSSRRSKK